MRRRRHVVRALGVAVREEPHGRFSTEIGPTDHCRLHLLLLNRPEEVLRLFPALQIVCLAQMEGWEALRTEHPAETARVVALAALMGIPEGTTGPEPIATEDEIVRTKDEAGHHGRAVAGGAEGGQNDAGDCGEVETVCRDDKRAPTEVAV